MKISDLKKIHNVGFGTSGVRGLVTDLTDEVCYTYTRAFLSTFAQRGQKVALGMDLRSSSERIYYSCMQAVIDSGMIPVSYGPLPSPALALIGIQNKICTVMITGSHIPEDRNGIKFTKPTGEITKKDEEVILNTEITFSYEPESTIISGVRSWIEEYESRYVKFFGKDFLNGITVGVYQHSTVARDFFCDFYTKLGAKVIPFGRASSFIPVDTEAVRKEDIALIKDWTSKNKVDLVVSADGDGDRPLVFTSTGNLVRGDILGLLTSKFLKADYIACPITCTTAIELSGNNTVRTKVGSPYVIEAMEDLVRGRGTVAGFEANGGFLIQTPFKDLDPLPTRDATIVHLSIIGLMKGAATSLDELVDGLPKRFTKSDRIQNVDLNKVKILFEDLKNDTNFLEKTLFRFGRLKESNYIDGLRFVLSDNNIIHFRMSGNAPELRIYIESSTEKEAESLLTLVTSFISSCVV